MENSFFSIRQVIELTGVSEYVLRAWELRYHAFHPKRTDTGRRLYSKQDLEKARTLWELTRRGHKISEIASLSLSRLKKLLETHKSHLHVTEPKTSPQVDEIISLTHQHEWDRCRKVLLRERGKLPVPRFIHEVILPLVRGIGTQVANQNLTIAQEHILSSFIKENLNVLSADRLPKRTDTRIVFASPEGDMHEIGLLIALALARHSGASTLYIGPNTPKLELCDSALRFRATHLLISSTLSREEGAKDDFLKYLNFLDQQLPPNMTFWLGGRNIEAMPFSLERPYMRFDQFRMLEEQLKLSSS